MAGSRPGVGRERGGRGALLLRAGSLRDPPGPQAAAADHRRGAHLVKADGDAVHVEIEALRAWAKRVLEFDLERDEIQKLAEQNQEEKNRDWIEAAVRDRHRTGEGWTKEHDRRVIDACTRVLVADLRNRDVEKAYLRRLAQAVGADTKRCDEIIANVDALEFNLERLVVDALTPTREGSASSPAA
jgi:hypothetical protein